jgi:hypothetical protein
LEEIAYPHEPQIVRAALSVLGRDLAQTSTTPPATGQEGQREGQQNAPGAVQEAMQQAGVESEIREASR